MVRVSEISSGLKTVWRYGKRVLEAAPELAFGSASEVTGSAIKATKGSIFTKAQAGWHALEKAGSGSFFKGFWNNCRNFFPEAANAFKDGGFKKLFKNLGSKMSFIGAALFMLWEVPNIYTAVKEKGIFQGAKEVLKFGARMTTAGLGAAIGLASPIPCGSLIGWIAGEWIGKRIFGKPYTEQKEEKEELIKELTGQNSNNVNQQQVENPQQSVEPNPYWLNNQTAYARQQPSFNGNMSNPFDYNQYKYQSMPYADDIMMKNMQFNTVV